MQPRTLSDPAGADPLRPVAPAGALRPLRTRVQRLEHVSAALGSEVWVKREDETHAELGGGKVRKLAPLLEDARAKEATHLLTLSAVGSNHVLATAWHGAAAGLQVVAAVVPHRDSDQVRAAALRSESLGVRHLPSWNEPHGAARIALEAWRLRRAGARPYFIPPGGTSSRSVRGCQEAGAELAIQVERGELPGWPDEVFCVLGSGGTAAGLWSSLAGSPVRLHAVRAYPSWLIGPRYLSWLAQARGLPRSRLLIDNSQLGSGYGHPTEAGQEAQRLFALDGLPLELSYTAKAAAALIAFARYGARGRRLLLWFTAPGVDRTEVAPAELSSPARALLR